MDSMEQDLMQNSLFTSNSKRVKNVVKALVFVILLAMMINLISDVLSIKTTNGIAQWNVFYDIEEESLDVLVLGSSHAFVNINPVVMYEESGIAAFNLCSSMQNMWNTYYFLKEALKYQSPELIVLEAYGVCYNDDYTDFGDNVDIAARVINNNYGMKWSENRIESIFASVPEGRRVEFLIELIQTHNRYEDIKSKDFYEAAKYPEGKTWRGQVEHYGTYPEALWNIHALDSKDIGTLTPKTEEYYRKVLELAEAEDIPVLIVFAPFSSITDEEKDKINKAMLIAEEYGVDCIDCTTSEFVYNIGLDFKNDYVDQVHMNYRGDEKFSKYLASYLDYKYDLPDRRGNDLYADWEAEIEVRKQTVSELKAKEAEELSE